MPAIIQPGSVFSPDVTLLAAKNAKLDLGGVLGGVEGVLGVPEPHPTHTGAGVRPFLTRHHQCVLAADRNEPQRLVHVRTKREHYSSPCFGCNLMTLPFLEVEGPSIQAM